MNDADRDALLIRLDERSAQHVKDIAEVNARVLAQNGTVKKLDEKVQKHSEQIAFWRGAIALVGTLLMLLATFFAGHVFGGGGK